MFLAGRHAERFHLNLELHNILAPWTRNPVLAMNSPTLQGLMHELAHRYDQKTDFGFAERHQLIAALRVSDGARATRVLLGVMNQRHRYIFSCLLATPPFGEDAEDTPVSSSKRADFLGVIGPSL